MLLVADRIRKSFAGVEALRGVSFDLRAGEIHALVGENGAGKSTLIRVITGAETPDSGTLTIDGEVIHDFEPALARARGVAAIYQQPALFPDLTVAENIALALDTGHSGPIIDWRRRRTRAAELLEQIGAHIDPASCVAGLSLPEQQLVEIAKVVGADARVMLMDEPTASLTDREVNRLLDVTRRLRDHGVGIIYISHRLEEVFALADRVTVLRDGHTVATKARDGLTMSDVIRLMVGRDVTTGAPASGASPGPVVLEVRHLSSQSAGLTDVSLSVHRGEIVGLAGLVGSGRTGLAEVVFGLLPADRGEILLHGAATVVRSPADAIRHGIAYVPEDRRQHGVVSPMSVAVNISLARLAGVSRVGLIDDRRERALAERYVSLFGVNAPSIDTPVSALSGGNQQKVSLARWLATDPTLLILDEPTQGIDVGAKAEIHRLVRDLASRGLAILMISSDLPEVLAMSDRVCVMHGGRINGTLARAEATPERVLALALNRPAA